MDFAVNTRQRLDTLEAGSSRSGQPGVGGTRDSIDRAGKWKQRVLIYEKELNIPEFPSDKPGAEAFRNWLRDFGRYVQRHVDYPCAEILFKSIKTHEDAPIVELDHVLKLYAHAQQLPDVHCIFVDSWTPVTYK